MILWVLAACGIPAFNPTWTATGALDPHRARMDVDHDGRLTAAEYAPVLWIGPPFANVDADGDGDLGVEELATLFATASPTRFDNAGGGPDRRAGGANQRLLTREQRHVWETLVWMGDTLRAAEGAGPDPVAVDAAVASGSLDSPEARVVLEAMRPGWSAQGWPWPFAERPTSSPQPGPPAAQQSAVPSPVPPQPDQDPSAVVTARIRAQFDWGSSQH